MTNRFVSALALCFLTLPLVGCSSDDADDGPSPWAGKTYLFSVPKANWTEPRTIGKDIDGYVPSFIMKVEGSSKDALSVTLGAAAANATPDTAVQDLCSPTTTIKFSGANDPKEQIGPTPLRIHVLNPADNPGEDNVQVTSNVYGFTMKDILPNGGTTSETGVFTATMDFADIYPLFTALGSGASADDVCEELGIQYGEFGGECVPCPTAAADPYCLTIKGEQVGAVEAPNLEFVPVVEADRDESCEPIKFQ